MNSTEHMRDTILVVDDTLENLDVLITSMESFGFNFSVARSGEEMFRRLEQIVPALILLDVRMPGMNGFEACSRLKADERFRQIPVIFMTALTETIDKVKGFELGAVDYITKPFQQEEVLARLKTHLTIQDLQNDLRSKNEELHAALERERSMLEDLRVNMSYSLPHELRTPLHAIIGFTGTILDASSLPEECTLRKYLTSIQNNGRRLQHLIENALLYADLKMIRYTDHAETQARRGSQYSFEISGILEELAGKVAKEQRRESDLELDLEKIRIRMTPKHFTKIFAELLENAFKFSPAGTPVRLCVRAEAEQCIISISDRGRGMSAEQIEAVNAYIQFERRYYEQQGIGLGLIIAQLLTSLEGGEFSIESELEKGTTSQLIFRVDPPDAVDSFARQLLEKAEAESRQGENVADMRIPEKNIIKALLTSVEIGDILEVESLLKSLKAKDVQYAPFVRKILPFIEELRLEQLREFLLKHLA